MGYGMYGMTGYPYNMMMGQYGVNPFGGGMTGMYGGGYPFGMMGYDDPTGVNPYAMGMGYGGYGMYGMNGLAGMAGMNGINGLNGMNGMNGMNGINGMNGMNGNTNGAGTINNGNTRRSSGNVDFPIPTIFAPFNGGGMEEVIARDRAAFIRQLEASNPETKMCYAQSLDVRKHVKNLSVRYLSRIMPKEHDLDDWIVLPLFQHGQDIPIDNDGRTAILMAHAPSLDHLLESWRKRIENERRDLKEKRRQQKAERREARHQRRSGCQKRRNRSLKGPKGKRCKSGNAIEAQDPPMQQEFINVDVEMRVVKEEDSYGDQDYGLPYPRYDQYVGDFGTLDDSMQQYDPNNYDWGPPLFYELDSYSENGERVLDFGNSDDEEYIVAEDWTRTPKRLIKTEPSSPTPSTVQHVIKQEPTSPTSSTPRAALTQKQPSPMLSTPEPLLKQEPISSCSSTPARALKKKSPSSTSSALGRVIKEEPLSPMSSPLKPVLIQKTSQPTPSAPLHLFKQETPSPVTSPPEPLFKQELLSPVPSAPEPVFIQKPLPSPAERVIKQEPSSPAQTTPEQLFKQEPPSTMTPNPEFVLKQEPNSTASPSPRPVFIQERPYQVSPARATVARQESSFLVPATPQQSHPTCRYNEERSLPAQDRDHAVSPFVEKDDFDAMLEMEQQLASIHGLTSDQNNSEVDAISLLSTEDRPSTSKADLKKHSASNKIKNSLLQRMAEGREIDSSSAVALENDYKNTFCYLCRIDFTSSKGLYLHNVKIHSEGEVQCDVCYKPLKNRITLMKHKKLHLGAEDMHCLCTECGRPFKDKRALTAHVTYTKHMVGPRVARTS
nr:Zinc finger domain containing protein [Haemonchus contortus]